MLTINENEYCLEDLMAGWECVTQMVSEGNFYFCCQVDAMGIGEFRTHFIDVVFPMMEAAYMSIHAEYDLPYDLEFIPDFLTRYSEAAEKKGLGGSVSLDDALTIAQEILSDLD